MKYTISAASIRSSLSIHLLTFKRLLLLVLGIVFTAPASAQVARVSATGYAKYVALSEVCTALVPENAEAIRAGRSKFEYDNGLALLVLKTRTDIPTLTSQYRELMDAADTVFTTGLCAITQFSDLPLNQSPSNSILAIAR